MNALDNKFCAIVVSALAVLALGAFASNGIRENWGTELEHKVDCACIIDQEQLDTLGGSVLLTPDEQKANLIITGLKLKELDDGFANLSHYNPAQHFFKRKIHIDSSPIFNIIRMMPKGAVLHVHDVSLLGTDYLLNTVTYMDNLYICHLNSGNIKLLFSKSQPEDPNCEWRLLKDVRKMAPNVESFDTNLASHFTMNAGLEYDNVDTAWKRFNGLFELITPMLTYKPVWEAYFYEALKQFYDDGVFYVELRSTLPTLYDLDGTTCDPIEVIRTLKNVNDRFVKDYPDAFGFRVIFAPLRLVSNDVMKEYVNTAIKAKAEFGDFFAGFDLVGQEDKGRPLKDFIPELTGLPSDINVFYHSGETNWYAFTDNNLIDAVLLGAKRIGHGFALLKHPRIAQIVKDNGIAIEINPLSNQILKLVEDMRNHPAAIMIANNYPVVISSDDPGLWDGLPMSHDMYMAFMGLSARDSDIKLLKQLTLNSIKYSVMPPEEKALALARHENQWKQFISKLLLLNNYK